MGVFALNRIRILKTGLADVQRYIDMTIPENRAYFETLSEPGTQLKLKRVHDCAEDPFRIEVYAPDDRFLGRVTLGKNETAARLMDAGLRVIAIVNRSMPVHDSDVSCEEGADESGWGEESRRLSGYEEVNLPRSLYYVDG